MKNTTLLKVLSATAIFSAIAAIEAYDQDSFAYAAETTVVTNNSTTSDTKPTTTKPAATPAANSATASSTAPATTAPKAEEPATVAQDVKALKDGEYKITAEALNFYVEGQPSMAAAGLDNEKTKLIVKNGQYSVSVTFKPIKKDSFTGYLGDLKYYDGDKTHNNRYEIKDTKENSEFKETNIVENYTEKENDEYIKIYKENFPNRTVYPKTFTYNVDKNKIDTNNKLETYTKVFIPVMEALNTGSGTQKMILKFDLTSLSRTKVTADNYEAATYKNPNKDVEYTGKINKEFPIHVQGHFRNANNNDEESLYGSALDSYVKVEKVGDKYKYTLRFKKGLADVGGEFYPFELHKVAYEGKDIPLTTLATNGNSSVKEGSITTDKLLEKIQLDGTAPYPNGALMSHFVTLKLYYETATPYKERPVKLEDVVAPAKPKPTKPTPAPVKPKEEPKPAAPAVPDHAVTADKVPTTFPTTVKGELKYQKDNEQISTYANLFEKDVKIEKQGPEYKYTFKIKEATGNTFVTKRTKYQFSKISYNGNNALITPLDGTNKEVSFTTNQLLDKVQLKMTVVTKQDKKGNEIDATLDLNFPTVENTKEEAANNLVSAKIYDAHVANKLSMADGALVHEKTRVEKVNDTYHYYLTFKNLQFGSLVGTVDSLSVDGKSAERTDLGGEGNEKLFHFTSAEKLTEKTINFAASANGKPLVGHSNVPATLNFNWNAATPLTTDQVTSLHNDETTKAQAEKEKLEREKAEAARLEKERLDKEAAAKAQAEKEKLEKEKAEAARLEKERLDKEAAAKAEKEKLEKEKAEAARLEKERLDKEAAAKAEKERLEKEKAEAARLEKEKAEREQAEADRLAKEKAEREQALKEAVEKIQAENKKAEEQAKAAKDTVTNLETSKAQLEKLVKEKEEAINNATTEAEKEKLATEKATAEKELTAKVTELKTETEKAAKLENKVEEIKKLEDVKEEAVGKIQAENKKTEKEAKAAKETVTKLEADKAQLEKLVKEKETAINNATTEVEKEKLTTEKAAVEKELTAKVTELKAETEKSVKLENKVNEAKQLEVIVKTASLKDTLVAKVEGTTEEIKVSFDNTAVKASNLVVKKADTETVAKVEKLAKKADENLNVVKTIDLHFEDSNHNIINKQGETRTVTVAVVANEDEKLEVYYINGDKLEKVPSVYKDGKLTFFTSHFSSYTIIKESKTIPSNQNTPVPVTPAPSGENEKIKSDKGEREKAEADRLEKERLEREKAEAKLEELKKVALANIATYKDVNKEEAAKLKEIVNSASLKDTLVAKLVENDSSETVTVTFDNTAIKADKLVVQKADKETAAKVEELVKKADENLSVVKTIDLHFESNNKTINKQGETRAVTVAVVANTDEKLEVYYVNGDKLEKVPSAYNYENKELTFFTNHFSIYTIVKEGKTVPSNKNEEIKSDKADATAQNIFGQVDNKENKNVEVEKTVAQNTSQTVAKGLKQLAKTGLNATATAGLGVLALLSALVLRRRNNK